MTNRQRFLFCPKCGGKLCYKTVDNRERLVCGNCSYILYENPIVGAAAIVMEGQKLLLGRRAAGSTYPGLWCIPCGYVEYDEDIVEAVKRECREETGLVVEPQDVFAALSNFHNPETHTVGIWFATKVTGGRLEPGDDIDKVAFFELDQIPPLAFATDAEVIRRLVLRFTEGKKQ
jgi:ADP-ribose pyrophosphatase YjhB (NUDIX family)